MATIIQFKRGYAQSWKEINPILYVGEPGLEYDTGKLKIGNGKLHWNELPYLTDTGGNSGVISANTKNGFPVTGKVDIIYKANNEKKLYQWNAGNQSYEEIGNAVDISTFNEYKAQTDKVIETLTANLSKKVDIVEGQRLITDEEAKKISNIVIQGDTIVFNGNVKAEQITGLDNWAKVNRDNLPGLLSKERESKLDNIEVGAQVNILESIKIEGEQEALPILNKETTLPKASAERFGLVKLSNEIGIDNNNALEIKSVNVNKLSQEEGDSLILDGGQAI